MTSETEDPSPDARAADGFAIVGIGASAGGLEALKALLGRVVSDSMAYVVVQHGSPSAESALSEILGQSTSLPVRRAVNGTRVLKNHLYVSPPDMDVALLHGVLHVLAPTPDRPRRPIDSFFRSLAEDHGALSVGVVLSGAGDDGVKGLEAIKAEGGISFAQRPDTARFDEMPAHAIKGGAADFVLSPEGIADELMALSHRAYLSRREPQKLPGPERLGRIFVLLREAFGHDLSLYKPGTIERRVERRMALHKLDRVEDYIALLQRSPPELAALYQDLLIGVTSFFRDRAPFEVTADLVFDRLVAQPPEVPIRIWVPACSTGEEPYSLAITLLERLDAAQSRERKVQVFATDVNHEAVRFSRRGVYPSQIAADVSPERLARFFVARPGGYQVGRRVREMVIFATQNIAQAPPFSRIDLVSCRNLLIYLQPVLQRKVLRVLHYALKPDGHLLLGTSESVGDLSDLFSLVHREAKLYRKKNHAVNPAHDVLPGDTRPGGAAPGALTPTDTRHRVNIQQLADRRVLDRFGPPGVVINEDFEVLQFRGRTGPYLEPLPGNASLNLLKLARAELVADLRVVVLRALERNAPAAVGCVPLFAPEGHRQIEIEAMPLVDPEARGRCLVVVFIEDGDGDPDAVEASSRARPRDDVPPRELELELELSSTKEYLQSVIEELETTNDELQSANEELQSANEELQSANEELETSKDELQSTVEELVSVNDELRCRVTEVGQSNGELQALLTLVETPVLIVDLELRVRRYTLAAERLMHLTPGDVGQALTRVAWLAPAAGLEHAVRAVLERGSARAEDVTAAGGERYRVTVTPYRPSGSAVGGASLTFAAAPARAEA